VTDAPVAIVRLSKNVRVTTLPNMMCIEMEQNCIVQIFCTRGGQTLLSLPDTRKKTFLSTSNIIMRRWAYICANGEGLLPNWGKNFLDL
jgi:hypothetical protein